MTSISKPVDNVIASKDSAQTFAESDVTIGLPEEVGIASESVKLLNVSGSGITFTETGSTALNQTQIGLKINPNTELSGVDINNAGDNMTDQADRFIIENSSGTEIFQTTEISYPIEARPSEPLVSGNEYSCYFEDDGSLLSPKEVENPVQSTTDFDTTAVIGEFSGILDINAVKAPQSGTATIEWPRPNDVYRWDAATFTRTHDGGSVDVFVEESTDGGSTWTEIAGPISRGSQIDADPLSRVRFRIELHRGGSISNDPSLDSIYRRWVV